MRVTINGLCVAGTTGVLVICFYQEAYAYLDPASGSFVFQSVVAVLLGTAFAVKTCWKGLRSRFSHGNSKQNRDKFPRR